MARRLRAKRLVGKTIHCWYRQGATLTKDAPYHFKGGAMQTTIPFTDDGLEIFKSAWKIFHQMWSGEAIRMIGVSISNLQPQTPQNLTFLEEDLRQEKIIKAIDKINDKYGEFTLQRGILLGSAQMCRKPNPYLADRRFKI